MSVVGEDAQSATAFRRLIWELAEAGGDGPAALAAAQRARSDAATSAVEERKSLAALVPLPGFEVARLLSLAHRSGMYVRILGPSLPDPLKPLFAAQSCETDMWCAVLTPAAAVDRDDAWQFLDYARAAIALGIPPCCASTACGSPRRQARWDLIVSHCSYRLLPLGLAPTMFLPCDPGCAQAAAIGGLKHPSLSAFLDMPSKLSAGGGLAEILTPRFRLIFDSPDEVDIRPDHRDCALRPVEEAEPDLPLPNIGFGSLPRARSASFSHPPELPVSIPDFAEGWPALRRWTPEWPLCIIRTQIHGRLRVVR